MCHRIVFREERTQLGIDFFKLLDAALKLERSGDVIIIYMDKTYYRLLHMPGKMWYRDVQNVHVARGHCRLFFIRCARMMDGCCKLMKMNNLLWWMSDTPAL